MYNYVDRNEIIERIEHIRDLHRQRTPSDERQRIDYDRREQKIKDFLSNVRRTGLHPTLTLVKELQDLCALTAEGGHRLFGFELDSIREFDTLLNGSRTHIVESYAFSRDLPVELPLELAPPEAFAQTAALNTLVLTWQRDVPIRALRNPPWRQPGTFYIRVGTEDSLGSNLPPGSIALVEPIQKDEMERPNPRHIYLLEFRNGFRCSQCVVSRGKLHVLAASRAYRGPEEFPYPSSVRIAGRIRLFAVGLPLEEQPLQHSLRSFAGNADDLSLPWENPSRHSLFASQHRRFKRSPREKAFIEEFLNHRLQANLSERTRRRYRAQTESQPHVNALIQMSLELYTRYSDALRAGGYPLRDSGRYSLETMLKANRIADLFKAKPAAKAPSPADVWEARRKEIVEWPALLSLQFPRLSLLSHRIVRVGEDSAINSVEPRIRAGSWLLLEDTQPPADPSNESTKTGWGRPLFALARGMKTVFGYVVRHEGGVALLSPANGQLTSLLFPRSESEHLRRVCGAIVPV